MPARQLHGVALLTSALAVAALAPTGLFAQDTTSSEALLPEGVGAAVQPGDRVEVSMFTAAGERLDEVSGLRTVDRNGRLFFPYVGEVDVRGLEAADIRELLSERYSDFYSNPVLDVETEIRVNVTGAVRQPGNYFLTPTSTLVDALATAGGTTSEVEAGGLGVAADPSEVRLVRRGIPNQILDLRPEEADSAVLNMPISSGDWLHVPPRSRSRWRANLQLASSFLSVIGSIAALVIIVGD